jgi:Tfp pilus assembly protein PilV
MNVRSVHTASAKTRSRAFLITSKQIHRSQVRGLKPSNDDKNNTKTTTKNSLQYRKYDKTFVYLHVVRYCKTTRQDV